MPPSAEDLVVLVDAADRPLGTADKLSVHQDGRLHRAVSVFLFDPAGRWLLQRRADGKYHSPGQWSNAACTHPRPGEAPVDAARRRLTEEMGVRCALQPAFTRLYRAELAGPHRLVEHELDHVFVGEYEGAPAPAAAEVSGWQWVEEDVLHRDLADGPDRYTPWFHILAADARLLPLRAHGQAA